MGIAEQLSKLEELHRRGTLNDEEFEKAKARVLDSPATGASADRSSETLGRAANRYVSFQIGMALIGLAVAAFVFFQFFLPHFRDM